VLEAQGDLPGAREQLERLLVIRMKLYGDEHPSTAITQANLGLALMALGESDRSFELIARAFLTSMAKLGPEHPQTQKIGAILAGGEQLGR
jgi:hypothetical protein